MQPGDVVMLGDSITEGGDWATLFPRTQVHNHGIGGDDTVGVLRRLDLVTRAQPAKVFLMIGTNDLGKGTLTIDEIVANVEEIVTRIRIENPTSELYVQSVLPRWHTRTDDLRRLNDGIESVACGQRCDLDRPPSALRPGGRDHGPRSRARRAPPQRRGLPTLGRGHHADGRITRLA